MKLIESTKIDLAMGDILSAARLADGLSAQGRPDLALIEIDLIYAILSDAALLVTHPGQSAPSQSKVSKPLKMVDWTQSHASNSNTSGSEQVPEPMRIPRKLEITEFQLRLYEQRKKRGCSLLRRLFKRSFVMISEFFAADRGRLT